jgi:hypothetical protein
LRAEDRVVGEWSAMRKLARRIGFEETWPDS